MLFPAGAGAQEAVEQARAQYRVGVELVREENWAEAEAAFERAYALYPEPLIIFNLASVRVQLGRLLEARRSYEEFLQRATEEQESYIGSAREQLESINESIGRIDIQVRGYVDGDIVQLDGRAVERGPNEADPGAHTITVRRGTAQVARTRIDLDPGASMTAELVVINPERVVTVEAPRNRTPLIAGLITAGLVLVGGAVAAAILVRRNRSEPFQGNVGDVVTLPLLSR